MTFTRQQAWEILCEFTQSDALRKHGQAVEACVVAYAHKFGEDEELWSVTGLLHDFDWEVHPQVPDHPVKGSEILAARGVPEVIRKAILSHVPESSDLRVTPLEKTLFACDELAGFLTAYAYVKPTKSIHDVDAKGVRKKMKDKAFCADGESRRHYQRGGGDGRGIGRAHRFLHQGNASAGRRAGLAGRMILRRNRHVWRCAAT